MSDNKPTDHITTSYAYAKRGDLPSEASEFYRDAGLSKAEFEVARAAQIIPEKVPARFADRDGSGGRKARTFRHELPQPRPDFAPPDRRLYEQDWFQKSRRQKQDVQPAHGKAQRHIRKR